MYLPVDSVAKKKRTWSKCEWMHIPKVSLLSGFYFYLSSHYPVLNSALDPEKHLLRLMWNHVLPVFPSRMSLYRPFVKILTLAGVCVCGIWSRLISLLFTVGGSPIRSCRAAVCDLHSQQTRRWVPFLHTFSGLWCFSECLSVAIQTGVSWYLIGGLICFSLLFNDVDIFHVIFFFF